LLRLLYQYLLIGAAVAVMVGEEGEPDQDDRDDCKYKDYEVAWAGAAQCPVPSRSRATFIEVVKSRFIYGLQRNNAKNPCSGTTWKTS
jgi:hypothetical protein